MRAVYKYPLSDEGISIVELPSLAHILHIQRQFGRWTMWAEVDTEAETSERRIGVFGTGHELPPEATVETFIATVADGPFMWHFYDVTVVPF